jgi:hypothetical protein
MRMFLLELKRCVFPLPQQWELFQPRMEDRGWKMEHGRREKLQLMTDLSAKIICALNHAIEHSTHLLPHLI